MHAYVCTPVSNIAETWKGLCSVVPSKGNSVLRLDVYGDEIHDYWQNKNLEKFYCTSSQVWH